MTQRTTNMDTPTMMSSVPVPVKPKGEVAADGRRCEVDGIVDELVSNGDVAREPPPELGVKEDVGLNTVLEGYDV